MRKSLFGFWSIVLLMSFSSTALAVESDMDRLLNLLVRKNVITSEEAAGLRTEIATAKMDEAAKQKDFSVLAGRPGRISGLAQFRYVSTQEAGKSDNADMRRARLDFKGDMTSRYEYDAQIELGGTKGPFLLDGTIAYKRSQALKLTVGQFKVPFSQENLQSDSKPDTINRSQAVEALVARGSDVIGNQNGRDIGVQASGGFVRRNDGYAFDYSVGLLNGAGINTADKNDQKDIAGRLVYHDGNGLDLGAAFYDGIGNWGAPAKNQTRNRLGGEFTWVRAAWTIKGEFIAGKDGATKRAGGYFQTAYFFAPKKTAGVLKLDMYDPDRSKTGDKRNVVTFGINRCFNKWSTLLLNYELKQEPGAETDNDTVTSQFILAF
jgi:phosphate-selective porin OprO and OprP